MSQIEDEFDLFSLSKMAALKPAICSLMSKVYESLMDRPLKVRLLHMYCTDRLQRIKYPYI